MSTEAELVEHLDQVNKVVEEYLKGNDPTKISKELDFCWATDPIVVYNQHPILHMAGVTDNLKSTKFYKGDFINVDPIEKLKENPNYFNQNI